MNKFIILISIFIFNSNFVFAYPSLNLSAVSGVKSNAALSSDGEFKTINQNSNFSAQEVAVDFNNDLSSIADLATAFYSISGIKLAGSATQANNMISQKTSGGQLNIWSDSSQSNLVLSGNLGEGKLSGAAGSTALKYESWTLNVTGGIVLSKLTNPMLDLTLDYSSENCLVFSKRCFLASTVTPSVGITNGNLSAMNLKFVDGVSIGKTNSNPPPSNPPPVTQIPEPASILLFSLAGGALASRRRKN